MVLRDKKNYLASKAATYTQYLRKVCEKKQKILEPNDLVFVRNYIVNGEKRRKLESKYLGPEIFVFSSALKILMQTQKIYDDKKTKKYSFNNVVLFKKRSAHFQDGVRIL